MISDCGIPEGSGYSLDKVEEWDGIGITRGIHVACYPWYTQHGSGFFLCRSWRKGLSCTLKPRNTELTCEKEMMTITCLTGIIFIEDAIFGRTKNSSVCPHNQIKNTNCTSTRSEAIIKTKCDGVPVCSVEVDYDKLGGDPCPGTYKYLEVNFICY